MKNQKHSRFEKLFSYITTTTILISNLNLISFAGAGNDNGDLIKQGASNLTLTQEDNPNNRISSQNPDEPLKVDESSDDNNPDVEEDTIKISSYEELCNFATIINDGDTSKNAELTNDITADNSNWKPIGTESNPFSGYFNGNHHSISGINLTGGNYVGLFGYNGHNGTIENIIIKNSSFSGKKYVGGICANNSGTIQNCINTGNISGTYAVGGNIGHNNSNAKVTNCFNEGIIEGIIEGKTKSRYIGGNVGINENNSKVQNCVNNGEISGYQAVGGNVGLNKQSGTLISCTNNGNISGIQFIGGNSGINNGDNTSVYHCNNTGNISGTNTIGGNVGQNINTGEVNNCINKGIVKGNDTSKYIGGNVGQNGQSSNVTLCSNYGEISGYQAVGGNVGQNKYLVENCENSAKIYCSSSNQSNLICCCFGGNVGQNKYNGTINSCNNSGEISGIFQVGGNVGNNTNGKVNYCENKGSISGSRYIGGIVGMTSSEDSITKCTNNGQLNNDRKYSGRHLHMQNIYGGIATDTLQTTENTSLVTDHVPIIDNGDSTTMISTTQCSSSFNTTNLQDTPKLPHQVVIKLDPRSVNLPLGPGNKKSDNYNRLNQSSSQNIHSQTNSTVSAFDSTGNVDESESQNKLDNPDLENPLNNNNNDDGVDKSNNPDLENSLNNNNNDGVDKSESQVICSMNDINNDHLSIIDNDISTELKTLKQKLNTSLNPTQIENLLDEYTQKIKEYLTSSSDAIIPKETKKEIKKVLSDIIRQINDLNKEIKKKKKPKLITKTNNFINLLKDLKRTFGRC